MSYTRIISYISTGLSLNNIFGISAFFLIIYTWRQVIYAGKLALQIVTLSFGLALVQAITPTTWSESTSKCVSSGSGHSSSSYIMKAKIVISESSTWIISYNWTCLVSFYYVGNQDKVRIRTTHACSYKTPNYNC